MQASGARRLGRGEMARLRGRWVGTYNACGLRMEARAPDGKALTWEECEGLKGEIMARVKTAPAPKTRSVIEGMVEGGAILYAVTDVHVVDGSREMDALRTYVGDKGYGMEVTGGWSDWAGGDTGEETWS